MSRWRAVTAVALCLLAAPALAEQGSVAAAVKATFLVKFGHYVTWPAEAVEGPTAPLVLCIAGHDPFGSLIDRAAQGEHVDQHPIVVRRMSAVGRNSGCHIVFLSGDAGPALAQLDGTPVLSVTDAADSRARGMVQFEVRGGHVGFHLDDMMARRGGLSISSRLLSIALSVRSREGGR